MSSADEIKAVEESCIASIKGVNGIAKLLGMLDGVEGQAAVSAFPVVHALRRVFTFYLQSGQMRRPRPSTASRKRPRKEAGSAVATWLHARLAALVDTLTGPQWLHSSRPKVRLMALRTVVHFVAHGPAVVRGGSEERHAVFDKPILACLLAGILTPPGGVSQADGALSMASGDVCDALVEEFADEYDDFRLHTLSALTALAGAATNKSAGGGGEEGPLPPSAAAAVASQPAVHLGARMADLLFRIGVPPSEEAWGPRSFLVPPAVAAVGEEEAGEAAAVAADAEAAADAAEAAGAEDAAYVAAHAGAGEAALAAATAHFARTGRSAQRKRRREDLKALTGGVTAVAAGSLAAQHRAFQDAWLGTLRLPLPPGVLRRVLTALRGDLIPCFVNPLLLADFLSRAYAGGGVVALLSLEALWHLITDHGLEYPTFYPKLYALLTLPNVTASTNARFMTLLDMFLTSAALPAYLVAAFAKRLARLSLRGPPTVACLALPLMYNVLKRHPACTPLLHRAMPRIGRVPQLAQSIPGEAAAAEEAGGDPQPVAGGVWSDPFRESEGDPAKTGALASQLWEVVALQGHWAPQVARLASLFSQPMTRREFKVTEGAVNTFGTLMRGAMRPSAGPPAPDAGGRKRRHDRRRKRVSGEAALDALGATPLAIHTQDSVGDTVREAGLATGAGDDGWEGNPYFLQPLVAEAEGEGGSGDGVILPPPQVAPDSDDEGVADAPAAPIVPHVGVYGAPFGEAALASLDAVASTVARSTRSVNLLAHVVDFAA